MQEHVFENIPVETLPDEIRSAFDENAIVKLRIEVQPNIARSSSLGNSQQPKKRTFEEIEQVLSDLPKLSRLNNFSDYDLYDEFGLPK